MPLAHPPALPTRPPGLPAVRASMLMSAPEQPADVAPDARDQEAAARTKPRK